MIWLFPIRHYTLSVSLPFNLELYRAVPALLIFAWVVGLLARRGRVDAAGHGKALAALAIVTVASFLANVGDSTQAEGVKSLSFLLSYVAVFLLITSTVESTPQAEKIIAWIVVGGDLVSVAALYEGTTDYNVFNHLDSWIPALEQLPREVVELRGGRLRVIASSQHPIALGCALTMAVPLAVYLARQRNGRRPPEPGAGAAARDRSRGVRDHLPRRPCSWRPRCSASLLFLKGRRLLRYWPIIVVLRVVVHLAAPGAIGGLYKSFFPEEGLVWPP